MVNQVFVIRPYICGAGAGVLKTQRVRPLAVLGGLKFTFEHLSVGVQGSSHLINVLDT